VTVRPLQPDTPAPGTDVRSSAGGDASDFARALDAVGAIFEQAKAAEDAYAGGAGTLRDAVYRRAQADVALAVAAAAAQRTVQAVQTILSMQI
jgi:flagellar hook-basal body complex protein FliE